ncbi:unnamed protein product [Prorocentrum cordatum]|uniref:Integrase catalytic domain-containing protein n=1 Tax=Prorocentrum cordatum TaxID=2364126 RepID=A0ABN9WMI5_9DINO|nr:unnamed protein product [Polarella glacialis]
MIRRLVKGFAKDLRGQDFAEDFWAMSALQDCEEQLYGIESGMDKHFKKMPEDNVTLDKVKSWLMDLHILGGHMSKTNMRAMLQRRGCPSWQQALVGELICDACAETQDTQHQLEVHHRKLFAVLYMDAACKLAVRSVFTEVEAKGTKAYFELSGAQVLSAFLEDWWQRKPRCQFLISDPGGGFVSNQLREWCGKNAVGIIQSPGEFHGQTADLEILIRQIKKTARRISLDEPTLSLADCVSLACAVHNNQHKASGYTPVQWAHGTNHQGYQFAEEQARSVATRLRHSMRQKLLSIEIGDWIMYFCRGKNTGARGSWPGPARVLAIEPKVNLQRERADESASIEDEISVVWIVHGTRLIRCHPTQLRSSSQREVVVASLEGNIDRDSLTNVNILYFVMVLRLETTVQTFIQFLEMFLQICLEYQFQRRVRLRYQASPYDALYGPELTSAAPEEITSGPAGALIGDEAAVGPREGSPAEPLGVGPDSADGPVAEGFAGNQDPAGEAPTGEADERDKEEPEAKRIKLGVMDFMTRDFEDEVKYLKAWDNFNNQSVAYLEDMTIEREVIEVATDFTDIGAFLQDSTVWLSKRLGDGKATEVTYSKLAPGQQLEFDKAMCKEISQVIATKVLKRIAQEELAEIDESRLLKMRSVLTYKCQEGGARKPKARLVILGYQHPSLTELSTAAPTLGKLARNMLFQVCAQHKFKLKFGDVSSAFLQTDASEEFESLNVKVPTEVAHFFLMSWGWRQLRADQCVWIMLDSSNQLKGIIGVHVDDFIIGGDETSKLYRDAERAIRALYRWGASTSCQAEFSRLRVRQFKDFSITLDLYDYTNKFITEAEIDADRKKQAHLPFEPKEISLLRGVLGMASWRAQQVSPQYAVDVGLALSQVNNAKISDLVNANKLVKDMRKSASQVIKFHRFENYDWHELWMVQWADASDKLRPDGSKTGGLVTGLSTPDFATGSMANVSILGWRSFKLPRKISGSNNNETQSTAFGDEMLWLSRLMWAELHGVEPTRWKLDDAVKTVPGMLITDSRGIYDAILKSESPQLGMRSFKSGEEARGIELQILRTDVSFRWVNGLAMLADSLTKPGYLARHVMEEFLATQRWKCTFDEMFQSGRRRQRDGKGAFADAPEEADSGCMEGFLDPLESLCDDAFLSDSTRSLMRSRCM